MAKKRRKRHVRQRREGPPTEYKPQDFGPFEHSKVMIFEDVRGPKGSNVAVFVFLLQAQEDVTEEDVQRTVFGLHPTRAAILSLPAHIVFFLRTEYIGPAPANQPDMAITVTRVSIVPTLERYITRPKLDWLQEMAVDEVFKAGSGIVRPGAGGMLNEL